MCFERPDIHFISCVVFLSFLYCYIIFNDYYNPTILKQYLQRDRFIAYSNNNTFTLLSCK